jgi:hypothetical protein
MPADDSHRPSLLAPWLRHPARAVPPRARSLLKKASILGQIGAAAGALSAFWLDATSAQYHGGTADVAGWGMGIFILAALPLWIAARNFDSHPRLVSILFLVCGVWLALPSLWGLVDPAIFVAPDFMIEPTSAPEGIQMICSTVLISGTLLLIAAYFGFRANSLLSGRRPEPQA